jgi:N-acetyl-anhydromuramyl-L-alanine amidase AmpD
MAMAWLTVIAMMACNGSTSAPLAKHYTEQYYPTPNTRSDSLNEVLGIILHHTALPTVEDALKELTRPRGVSSHVIIDTDGSRYILAQPTAITYHAGLSVLLGREKCNMFTIGVEFQGNTEETPLTEDQINSGIEYMLPIIREYNIPLENIVTHKMVRDNYMAKYPEKKCKDKVDITQKEYERVMSRLREALEE